MLPGKSDYDIVIPLLSGWFLTGAPSWLLVGLVEVLSDRFDGCVPVTATFLRFELARPGQMPEVIDAGLEEGCQFLHGQKMRSRVCTSLQVPIQAQFNGLPYEIDDPLIVAC